MAEEHPDGAHVDVVDVGIGIVAAEEGGEEEVVGGTRGARGGIRGGAHDRVDVDGLGEHAALGIEVEEGVEVWFRWGKAREGESEGGDGVHLRVEASDSEALDGGQERRVISGEATAVAFKCPGEEMGTEARVGEADEGVGKIGRAEARRELGDDEVELGLIQRRGFWTFLRASTPIAI